MSIFITRGTPHLPFRAEQASTRLLAIERLISFLETDLSILSVYLSCEGHNARARLARIIRDMQAIPSARLSDLEQTLQRRSEELYLSLDVHCDGIILLSKSGTHPYSNAGLGLDAQLKNASRSEDGSEKGISRTLTLSEVDVSHSSSLREYNHRQIRKAA